jgi:hypothetical protein
MPFSARQGFFHQPAGGDTLWTPAEITTAVWLDAFDGTEITLDTGVLVTSWNNKSGGTDFNQTTTGNMPDYDSTNKCVTFDGTDEFMQAPDNFVSALNPDFMCVMLADFLSLQSTSDRLFQLEGGQGGGVISIGHGSGGTGWNWRHNNGFRAFNTGATTGQYMTSWVRSAGTGYSDDETWENGTSVSLSSGNNPGNTPTISQAFSTIGRGQGGNEDQFFYSNARLHELVMLEDDDSATREKIEGYMAWRWGNEGDLPVSHPYKDAAPTV